MWQQHDESALPHPLGLAAADELVDDALRRVGEVTELRFPDDQRVGTRQRVSQFESCTRTSRFEPPT